MSANEQGKDGWMTVAGDGPLRSHLGRLAADRSTGRLAGRGAAGPWWIHLHEGGVACAERAGHTTLVVAMAEAGLFTAEEWQVALRLPFGPNWTNLVGGDAERLRGLAGFARAYVVEALAAILEHSPPGAPVAITWSRGVAHTFGTLASWPLEELLADAPARLPRPCVPMVDRVEFLELLEEVSPLVRRRN